jgi:DNA-binding transcriptional MerR regulator
MSSFPNRRPRAPHRDFSISDLRREFGLSSRALRFYEERGLLSPSRRGMERVYSYKERARVALIVRGRRVGLSVADIREILEAYAEGEDAQNRLALEKFNRRINALRAERLVVDQAIQNLESACRRLSSETLALGGVAAE